jgi:tRNA U34 5-methylaminomethyl-2-thiouridine-forming methyltransferase MnmC
LAKLFVFDVGLGAAANALAALHCAAAIPSRPRELRVISFERDLDLLRFALANADKFPHFYGYERPIQQLLKAGKWEAEGLHWELRHGNFLKTIKSEKLKPHLIYYDPYSQKVNSEMWSIETFREVRGTCRDDTLLMTYSQATPVRVALLAAGFFVGRGVSSGPKEETTQAAASLSRLQSPLGKEWLGRWSRSHQQVPHEAEPEIHERLRELVRKHPQFI